MPVCLPCDKHNSNLFSYFSKFFFYLYVDMCVGVYVYACACAGTCVYVGYE